MARRKLADEGKVLVMGDPEALEVVSSLVRKRNGVADTFVEVKGKRYRVITSSSRDSD